MVRCRSWLLPVVSLVLIFLAACQPRHFAQIEDEAISLYLTKPDAHQVQLGSSIDRFTLHSAVNRDGVWEVTLPYRGEFEYFYLVDGQLFLPECRVRVSDDFGSKNCLFVPNM